MSTHILIDAFGVGAFLQLLVLTAIVVIPLWKIVAILGEVRNKLAQQTREGSEP